LSTARVTWLRWCGVASRYSLEQLELVTNDYVVALRLWHDRAVAAVVFRRRQSLTSGSRVGAAIIVGAQEGFEPLTIHLPTRTTFVLNQ
jgi:hypothetical protein